MARFDLYRAEVGLLVDVQTNFLDGLTTRLVVPLYLLQDAPRPAGRLNPILDVDGQLYALQPQLMGAVWRNELGQPIDNLLRHYDRIVAALDMIFLGF
jgi:toxin CcdB